MRRMAGKAALATGGTTGLGSVVAELVDGGMRAGYRWPETSASGS